MAVGNGHCAVDRLGWLACIREENVVAVERLFQQRQQSAGNGAFVKFCINKTGFVNQSRFYFYDDQCEGIYRQMPEASLPIFKSSISRSGTIFFKFG